MIHSLLGFYLNWRKYDFCAEVYPRRWEVTLSKLLKRPTNCGKVIIKGKRANRRGGYGLEVPCEYLFKGDSFSCG